MRILIILLFALTLLSCSSGGTSPAARASVIDCTAAYRSSVNSPIDREETITFADVDTEQSLAFADLIFHAAYATGAMNNERSLRTWVTAVDKAVIYNRQLYQLPLDSGPSNQFVGGHGFTGLNYSYHPDSSAELQFWCEAR